MKTTHAESGLTNPAALSPLTARTLDVAERAGDLSEFIAPVRLPDGPVLLDGAGHTDWILIDARIDPHVQNRTLAIPREPRAKLRRLAAAGIDFDTFLIGHELPAGTIAKLPATKPGTPVDLKAVTKAIGKPPVDVAASRAATAARTIATAISTGVLALGSAAGALADLTLDPVIFGAVTADGQARAGDLAAVFYLCHWDAPPS